MTWYEKRKASGDCVQTKTCKRPRAEGNLRCVYHREALANTNRRWMQRRKQEGMCQRRGCDQPADATRCAKCAAEVNACKRKWYKRNRRKQIANCQAYVIRRRNSGKCRSCNAPRVTKDYCQKHRDAHVLRVRAARAAAGAPQRKHMWTQLGVPPARGKKAPAISDLKPMSLAEFRRSRRRRDVLANWSIT